MKMTLQEKLWARGEIQEFQYLKKSENVSL